MNQNEAWLKFKNDHPVMVEEALGQQVTKVFETITKSGILGRFGANAKAAGNFEVLIELFAEKTFNAGWNAREQENLTKTIPLNEEAKP